jgi:hypothetical protein
MAKIRKIGNKTEILKRKKELSDQEKCIKSIADLDEKQLDKWFDQHFSGVSDDVREGLEVIVKALWANAKVTRKMWQRF